MTSAVWEIPYHGWTATAEDGTGNSADSASASSLLSASKGLGGVPGQVSSSILAGVDVECGGVATALGGGGANFFLDSCLTRASQGGSLGLGVSLDCMELIKRWE